jgi:MOSC domain-containing protein YiiM
MATILTVNTAHVGPGVSAPTTGIDKRPVDGAVAVRTPGPMRSGLVGDVIGNGKVHGGDDQAVYAYAREDLDGWEVQLDRELPNGIFGENITTSGVDVTGAVIGERWRIGSDGLLLEVSRPRVPCTTFVERLGIAGWIKTFTKGGTPGAYLRVVQPGTLRGGDSVDVVERPDHGVTIGTVFRALTLDPALLPGILVADALPEPIRAQARRRVS